jgi:L-malate glycosyltransferase
LSPTSHVHVLYLVDRYPLAHEAKYGKSPSIFRGMSARGHQVGMIAFAAAYRGDPKRLLPQALRAITDRSPPSSVVIEDQASKWATGVLRRARLNRLIRRSWIPTFRGLSCARVYFRDFGKPDLVHAYGEGSAAHIALRLKRNYGIPFVWNVHATTDYRLAQPWGPNEKRLAEVLRECSRFLPVSEPLGRHWEAVFGPDLTANWLTIPNPVDETVFNFEAESRTKRGPSSNLKILNVSKLGSPNKGLPDLLRAFAIGFKNTGAELRLVGAPGLKQRAKALLTDLSITAQVTILGILPRDEVAREMRDCDIYAQPSVIETFANPVAEALMCGRPVVTTASGGPESLICESNGLVVPRNDPESLAVGLLEVAKDLDRYDPKNIRSNAVSRFGHEAVFGAMESTYQEVCSDYVRQARSTPFLGL